MTPHAAAGSIIFLSPEPAANEAYRTLAHWFATEPRLWGLYGFGDGFNLDRGWYAHDTVGIDQGMTLVALEDYRTGLAWKMPSQDPVIARARAAALHSPVYLPLLRHQRNPELASQRNMWGDCRALGWDT